MKNNEINQPMREHHIYQLSELQHERDSQLISEIMNQEAVGAIFNFLEEHHVDEVYASFYKASCICLTDSVAPAIVREMKRACDATGLRRQPKIYVRRSYDTTIEIAGLNDPFILMSSDYLECLRTESPELLYGIFAGRTSGILAGHHKAAMLFWAVQTLAQYLPIPQIFLTGLDGLLNSWNRNRYYTYDKAFYVVTGDYAMTLRNLFVHMLPREELDNFCFGEEGDAYLEQAMQFINSSTVDGALKAVNSFLSDDAWIPERYYELRREAGRLKDKEGGGC